MRQEVQVFSLTPPRIPLANRSLHTGLSTLATAVAQEKQGTAFEVIVSRLQLLCGGSHISEEPRVKRALASGTRGGMEEEFKLRPAASVFERVLKAATAARIFFLTPPRISLANRSLHTGLPT